MERLAELLARHPTVPLALRAAVAAVAAWLVVVPLGGVADDFPYYAPLGAVVSVSTTVLTSIRTAFQTAVALFAGAALAVLTILVAIPRPLGIGLVVGLGTLVAAWRWLGSMGTWVPISALFILVIGNSDPWHFIPGYLGLTSLGAVVGLAVNALVPPLRFAQAHRAQEELRSALVTQLEVLAEGLEEDPLPSSRDWPARLVDVQAEAERVRALLQESTGGPQVNWRARRLSQEAERLRVQGAALTNLAFLIESLADLLPRWERQDRDTSPLGDRLRPEVARALRGLADVLRSVEDSTAGGTELRRAWTALRGLADEIREIRRRTGGDLFEAGTLVTGIQRTLESVTPV